MIRVYDDVGDVIETHEHAGESRAVRGFVRVRSLKLKSIRIEGAETAWQMYCPKVL